MSTKGPTSNFMIKFFMRTEVLKTFFDVLVSSFPLEGQQVQNENTDVVLKFLMKLFEEVSLH